MFVLLNNPHFCLIGLSVIVLLREACEDLNGRELRGKPVKVELSNGRPKGMCFIFCHQKYLVCVCNRREVTDFIINVGGDRDRGGSSRFAFPFLHRLRIKWGSMF